LNTQTNLNSNSNGGFDSNNIQTTFNSNSNAVFDTSNIANTQTDFNSNNNGIFDSGITGNNLPEDSLRDGPNAGVEGFPSGPGLEGPTIDGTTFPGTIGFDDDRVRWGRNQITVPRSYGYVCRVRIVEEQCTLGVTCDALGHKLDGNNAYYGQYGQYGNGNDQSQYNNGDNLGQYNNNGQSTFSSRQSGEGFSSTAPAECRTSFSGCRGK
jgi:hypothetical protein